MDRIFKEAQQNTKRVAEAELAAQQAKFDALALANQEYLRRDGSTAVQGDLNLTEKLIVNGSMIKTAGSDGTLNVVTYRNYYDPGVGVVDELYLLAYAVAEGFLILANDDDVNPQNWRSFPAEIPRSGYVTFSGLIDAPFFGKTADEMNRTHAYNIITEPSFNNPDSIMQIPLPGADEAILAGPWYFTYGDGNSGKSVTITFSESLVGLTVSSSANANDARPVRCLDVLYGPQMNASLSSKISGFEYDLLSLTSTNGGAVPTLQEDVGNLQTDVSSLEGRVSTLEVAGDLAALTTEVNTNTSNISTLQSDLSALDSTFAVNYDDVAGRVSALESNPTDLGPLETDVSALQTDVSTLQSNVSALQSDKVDASNIGATTELVADDVVISSSNACKLRVLDSLVYIDRVDVKLDSTTILNDLHVSNGPSFPTTRNDVYCNNVLFRNAANNADIDLRATLDTNTSSISTLQSDVSTNTSDISTAESRITAIEAIGGENPTLGSITMRAQDNFLTHLDSTPGSGALSVGLNVTRQDALDVHCRNVLLRNSANDADIDTVATLEAHTADISTLQSDVSSNSADISTLQSDVSSNSSSISSVQASKLSKTNSGFVLVSGTPFWVQTDTEFAIFVQRTPITWDYCFSVELSTCICYADLRVDGSFTNPSDARAKYNIVEADYASAYERIKLTPMRSFMYRHPKADIPIEFGIVADELETHFPGMVSITHQDTTKDTGFKDANNNIIPDLKTVNVSGMMQVLAAAFKQSQIEIDALKARVAALESAAGS